ncbi:MAG TPA: nitroreductase [Pinirhizobacter sp.]|uniref:nitroreductase family protein n=1 Tax=Pinirhizobacter sp. TaxID=2950432 RepID=UPI002C4BB551|nr:nitroreductase [Pinirhizobacter sp.]HMH69454.1 nitroreductase [Pinirhizobacter sp.]
MNHEPLHALRGRRSVPASQLGAPGPDAQALRQLLEVAVRVPDHGKLVPFRMILLAGEAKLAFGARLSALLESRPGLSDAKREKERRRYEYAPLVIAVVSRIDSGSSVPAIEQRLAAGNVAYNLLLGAQALGFGAQWLTGWAAYDEGVAVLLGLGPNEGIVGFVHIGTPVMDAPERERPAVDEVVSSWTP